MEARNGSLRRELTVMFLTLFITMLGATVGWIIVDRIHWAANERQIEINTGRITQTEKRLDSLPTDFMLRQEHNAIEEQARAQHVEVMNAIRHLDERLDQIGRGRSQTSLFDPLGREEKHASRVRPSS